jgi:hypothetical protein
MKVSKRQLQAIIKEERSKLLREQPISGEQAVQMQAAQKAASDVKQQANMLAELDDIAAIIESLAKEMYGMSGPGTVSGDAGDEMARDLEMQIERLNMFYETMEDYFNVITSE